MSGGASCSAFAARDRSQGKQPAANYRTRHKGAVTDLTAMRRPEPEPPDRGRAEARVSIRPHLPACGFRHPCSIHGSTDAHDLVGADTTTKSRLAASLPRGRTARLSGSAGERKRLAGPYRGAWDQRSNGADANRVANPNVSFRSAAARAAQNAERFASSEPVGRVIVAAAYPRATRAARPAPGKRLAAIRARERHG